MDPSIELESLDNRPQTNLRWWVCALLFLATILGYIDRGLISFLKPDLQHDLHWNDSDYAKIVAAFSLAYAFGQLFSGRIMDLVGVRRGFVGTVGFWSVAAMGHAITRTFFGFESARFALGLAEGGNYPGASKAVAEWFPSRERALAAGIFNAGSNFGAVLTPIVATIITVYFQLSWRICFVFAGALGMIWIVPWLWIYRSPENNSGDSNTNSISWASLLTFRASWAFIIGLTLTSPIWWFYLYWFPDFLVKAFHLSKTQQQLPIVVVYVVAGIGSVGGGWISSRCIGRGMSVVPARKIAMLICALCVVPVFFAPRSGHLWIATGLIALAAAAHQGFASNLFTLISDTLPQCAVSSVAGMGGMSAGLMAMVFQRFSGFLLQTQPAVAYTILFGICSMAYPVAVVCVHALTLRSAGESEIPV